MYVEEIKKRQGKKVYKTVLVRESYRENGKVKHRTVANISKLPAGERAMIKASLAGNKMISENDFKTTASREFGASACLFALAERLGFDKMLYSRKEQWRQDIMAVIVGRIVYQGSKLALTNLAMDTALWELAGHAYGENVDVEEHCYRPMDKLLGRQKAIQQKLARRHLDDGCLILYDITNTWLEGEYANSELAAYGRGKGGKRGYKQISIGLITDKLGCPVAVEVFNGKTSDQTTVKKKVETLAEEYGVREVIFAGDRGMLTPKRIDQVTEAGFRTLTALTHPQVRKLLERRVVQPDLFDEKNIAEVRDPGEPEVRYMLCKNHQTGKEETETRNSLIKTVNSKLSAITNVKRTRNKKKVCARIGVVLNKYKIGKFYDWEVDEEGRVHWSLNSELVKEEEALDGCYVIRTEVSSDLMNAEEAVDGYKSLRHVEKAFRNLKTVALEIRPVYHKTDDRIRSHVFLCMLAYYLQWHAAERLKPLFETDGRYRQRRWSMPIVIERLKSIRKHNLQIDGIDMSTRISDPDTEQRKILRLLQVDLDAASNLKMQT